MNDNISTMCTLWRRWCSGIMQDSHSCDPGSIPGRCMLLVKNAPITYNVAGILQNVRFLQPGDHTFDIYGKTF